MAIVEAKKSKITVRYWGSIRCSIAFIGFLGMVTHFLQRTNISIALVCMVNHTAIEHYYYSPTSNFTETTSVSTENECTQTASTNEMNGAYVWSKNTQGIILGAYFWGYIITQIPAGYLASRIGARFILGAAILLSSLVSLFIPTAANIHWIALAILQGIVGLAHGTIWPCTSVVVAHWAPANERGQFMSFINAGAQIGNVLVLSLGGLMCSLDFAGGWPLIFYTTSFIGLIWSSSWIFFYTNSPRSHRYISEEEKDFILEHTQQQLSQNTKHNFHAPWKAILTSKPCWALFITHTCANYGTYTFLTSIPKYLSEVLKFNIKSNGLLSALPYICLWFTMNLTGLLADVIVRKRILTITNTRKIFTLLGTLLPAIFIVALAFMTCQFKYLAVTLLTIGITVGGFAFGGGFVLVANDIAPAYTGIIFGISNTFATIPGILSPYVVGALTEKNPNNWSIVFFICSAIYVVAAIAFLILASSELQPWAIKQINNENIDENLLSKKTIQSTVELTREA